MGKSGKKTNADVVADSALDLSSIKEDKKGKRGAEEAPEKTANSKKQKKEDHNKKRVKNRDKGLIELVGVKKDEDRSSHFDQGFATILKTDPPTKAKEKEKKEAEDITENRAKSKKQIRKAKKRLDKKLPEKPKKTLIEFQEKDGNSCLEFDGEADKMDIRQTHLKKKDNSESFEKPANFTAKKNAEFGSKRLYVGNVPSEAGRDDLLEFFKKAGEVTEIQLAIKGDGSFRGFGHVEFVTEEAARKALRLNGGLLQGRPLIVDLAHDRGSLSNPSDEGKENTFYSIGVQDPGHSVYVKGLSRSLEEDQIRSSLMKHFESCGDIFRIAIPQDKIKKRSKGYAFVVFNDQESTSNALELNGTELGGFKLTVEGSAPQGGSRDGTIRGRRGRRGRSGSRDGGRRGRGRD